MLIVSAALGACIGSFVNVVIYRLPRGLSVGRPRRSFCPACGRGIAGYDNIPILSYLLLRGRCRRCRARISLQYPLVELVTAFLFVATYDVFIMLRWRAGVGQWPQDGALVAAHWILWAGLLATAVMDIEAYMLDVRVTWFVAAAGILCHGVWTPESSGGWIRPGPVAAAVAVAAALVLGMTAVCAAVLGGRDDTSSRDESAVHTPDDEPPAADLPCDAVSRGSGMSRTAVVLLGVALLTAYLTWIIAVPSPSPRGLWGQTPSWAGVWRFALVAGGLMVLTVVLASAPRPEDREILEAIQTESPSARRLALSEAAWLTPSVVMAVLVGWAWSRFVPGEAAQRLLEWAPAGDWRPILGLTTGLLGWLVAGALGWAVRLIFTLLLGKEALGVGDIHLLAAGGAVAGWPVVVLGFFLSAPLALLGILIFALRRSSRAIQYGPWLGLGMFVAAAAQDRIIEYLRMGLLVS